MNGLESSQRVIQLDEVLRWRLQRFSEFEWLQ
jgi:hypothetical protein